MFLEITIQISLSLVVDYDILETDCPVPSVLVLEDEVYEYEYPQMTDLDVLYILELLHIVYGNGKIFAFYENEELDELYIRVRDR